MALGVSRDLPLFCLLSLSVLSDPPHDVTVLSPTRVVLYCGAFHRIHCILLECRPATGAPQGDRKEMSLVGAGSLVGKRDGSLGTVSSKI